MSFSNSEDHREEFTIKTNEDWLTSQRIEFMSECVYKIKLRLSRARTKRMNIIQVS